MRNISNILHYSANTHANTYYIYYLYKLIKRIRLVSLNLTFKSSILIMKDPQKCKKGNLKFQFLYLKKNR